MRYKARGQEYQVACYKNKLSSWRSGIESDLDEVLQVQDVFLDVVNGKRAKRNEVLQAFDCTDLDSVLKVILSKGEFQLNEDEREHELEAMFRDVCTIVVQKCVDSNTGLPLTFGVVERALREVHFAVHLAKAAKQQALAAIKVLEQNFPICRAKMRIRVELSASVDCAELLRQFDSIESDDVGRDGVRVVKGLCKSENFRNLDGEARLLSGRLEVIDLSAHGGSALAPQELLQQQLQQVSLAASQKAIADTISTAPDGASCAAAASQVPKPAFTCNTCAGSFSDAAEHRAHFKCDWHRINLKRKVLGQPPVDAAAADEITAKEKADDQKSLGGGGAASSGRGK